MIRLSLKFVFVFMTLTVASALAVIAGDKPAKFKSVVELFTSQGCSSCPPADALLKTYVDRDDIVALTMPVDYWDYLGWKDTYGSSQHSKRQRDYSRKRGDGRVYTPQVVVNGMAHAIGSDALQISKAIIATKAKLARAPIPISLQMQDGDLVIELGDAPSDADVGAATILLAAVLSKGDVAIKHGENRGRKLTYYNIVRKLTELGAWDGKAKTIRLSSEELMQNGVDGCAVLVQQDRNGPIIAAAEIWNW